MNCHVLSEILVGIRGRAIRNRSSCYRKWNFENTPAFRLSFERLTLNNLREDSNVRAPCEAVRALPSFAVMNGWLAQSWAASRRAPLFDQSIMPSRVPGSESRHATKSSEESPT